MTWKGIWYFGLALLAGQARGQIHSEPPADLEAGVVWRLGEGKLPVAMRDFSVTVAASSEADGVLLQSPGAWRLSLENGMATFEMEGMAARWSAPAAAARTLVVSVKRDPRQALSGLWVDGVERVSLAVAPGELRMAAPVLASQGVQAARVYDRALGRSEVLEWQALNAPQQGGSVVLMGGSEACAVFEDGRLEAALLLAGRAQRLRSLAWEGDTVFSRERPMGFGSLRSQLDRVGAAEVWLLFGRQEALEGGAAGAERFAQKLAELVREIQGMGRRVRVAGLAPLEPRPAPHPDLSGAAQTVAAYELAARRVAEQTNADWLPVLERWPAVEGKTFTRDGLTLNEHGIMLLAEALAGGTAPAVSDALVSAVREKNRLWQNYWRPTNWAFLHGDRTAQPSSRDHSDPGRRWFPAEVEEFKAMIESKEQELWRQASEQGRKLP